MTNDEHLRICDRLDETDGKLNKLLGQNDVLISQNRELISLLKKGLWYLFLIAVFELAVITYGAIGREGFNTIKGSVPAEAR